MLHFIRATMHENRTEECKRPSDRPKGSFLWHRRCLRGMANDYLQLQRTLRTAQRTGSERTLRTKRKAQRTPAYAISTIIYRASYVPGGCISEIAWSRFHRQVANWLHAFRARQHALQWHARLYGSARNLVRCLFVRMAPVRTVGMQYADRCRA